MVILRFCSDVASSISIAHTLRAFGPGLNPFAPYGMDFRVSISSFGDFYTYKSLRKISSRVCLNLLRDYKIHIIMPEEQLGRSLRRNLSSKRMLRSNSEMDDRGWSVLHVRARKGDLKEVRRLLSEGLDVNIPAWGPKAQGVTPLHLAAKGGHLKVMDELLEHGANIDARTKGVCGWTPLHKAAKERNREAVKYLIENGAFLPDDINDCRFNPPLHYCSGLEWAYEEVRKLQEDNTSSSGEGSTSES